MEDLSREYFERNFFLLIESNITIGSNLTHTIDSLFRIQYLPNGRIDFLTVDESARCIANTMMMMDQENLFKNHDK